ncbi:zinc finger protein, putative [Plasmodium malariae]|uniref:Zinc finger protein, putative n=1 Tax=Plasmodium malariae TaxID=5858 RepID=A0A1A8X1R8_PLAMA|nr:zinc finger protein, putative [Plasmodium malariae]SBS99172.1 zinc finger protein, putative [Plasmodium malariae]SCO93888.1 zinc finger protein, putative [Plasmodium malariae]
MVYATLLSEEDLSRFRTKQCKRLLNGGCNFGLDRCQYSHNEFWNRRCPFYLSDSSFIRYITVMCPDVETKSDGSINSLCLRGGECPFAHSSEEILYHPLYYKTKRCEDYKKGSCNTYYCPFIHGLAETRVPGSYKLPFTNGINIPNIPNIIIVDKIDISNKSSCVSMNDNNKYVKNGSSIIKKRSDLLIDDMTENETNYNKLNCIALSAYSSKDSISNKNDSCKMSVCKDSLSFNENLLNYSEEDIKLNLFNHSPLDRSLHRYTGKNELMYSINSFANYDSSSIGNNTTTISNINSVSMNNIGGSIYSGMGNGFGSEIEVNAINTTVLNSIKGNVNTLNNTRRSPSMMNCANYNELICREINGIGNNNTSSKGSNDLSSKSNLCANFTDKIYTNENFNKSFNILKDKQNYSSCSTAEHEISFNEQEVTSDDVIDDEEDDLETDENLNTRISNKNKDVDIINNNGSNQFSCSSNSLDEDKHSNEVNLLEVIKCLKSLYGKIIKGNLVFSPEQWDNIAQITYEIIGVVEFNRVLKLKRTTDRTKNYIYNRNKEFTFDKLKKMDINTRRMTGSNSQGTKGQDGHEEGSAVVDANLCADLVTKMGAQIIGENVDAGTKEDIDVDIDAGMDSDNDADVDMEVERWNLANQEEVLKTPKGHMYEIMEFGTEKDKKMISVQSDNKREETNAINGTTDITEEGYLINLYNEKLKENYLGEKSELDLLAMKSKFRTTQLNLNNEKTNTKDSHFLEYYNLNKNSLSFTKTKDNCEKASSHQPFMSFFSFLSE